MENTKQHLENKLVPWFAVKVRSLPVRVRWFRLFVVDSFGELSKSTGYRDKHLDLNGYGVGGLLYPPRTLPMWQNSFQVCKNRFFGFPLLKSDRILAIFTQTSSVTKRNIMDRMDKVLGMAYTPHQRSYSDRNDSNREKNLQFGRMCSKFVQNIVKHSMDCLQSTCAIIMATAVLIQPTD